MQSMSQLVISKNSSDIAGDMCYEVLIRWIKRHYHSFECDSEYIDCDCPCDCDACIDGDNMCLYDDEKFYKFGRHDYLYLLKNIHCLRAHHIIDMCRYIERKDIQAGCCDMLVSEFLHMKNLFNRIEPLYYTYMEAFNFGMVSIGTDYKHCDVTLVNAINHHVLDTLFVHDAKLAVDEIFKEADEYTTMTLHVKESIEMGDSILFTFIRPKDLVCLIYMYL